MYQRLRFCRSSKYSGNCIKMDTSLVTCDNLTSSSIRRTKSSSLILIGRVDMTIQDRIPDDIRSQLIPADTLVPTNAIHAQTDTTFAYYPLNLSKNLFSSTGVGDLQQIRPIHDWRMLNKLTFVVRPSVSFLHSTTIIIYI